MLISTQYSQSFSIQVETTYRFREEALNTCINYSQEKVSKAVQENDRAAQRQAQMEVFIIPFS